MRAVGLVCLQTPLTSVQSANCTLQVPLSWLPLQEPTGLSDKAVRAVADRAANVGHVTDRSVDVTDLSDCHHDGLAVTKTDVRLPRSYALRYGMGSAIIRGLSPSALIAVSCGMSLIV